MHVHRRVGVSLLLGLSACSTPRAAAPTLTTAPTLSTEPLTQVARSTPATPPSPKPDDAKAQPSLEHDRTDLQARAERGLTQGLADYARLETRGLGASRAGYEALARATQWGDNSDPAVAELGARQLQLLEAAVKRYPHDDEAREALIRQLQMQALGARWDDPARANALAERIIALEAVYRDARKVRYQLEYAERIDDEAKAFELRSAALAHLERQWVNPLKLIPIREAIAGYLAGHGDAAKARTLRRANVELYAVCATEPRRAFVQTWSMERDSECNAANRAVLASTLSLLDDEATLSKWSETQRIDTVLALTSFYRRASLENEPLEARPAAQVLTLAIAVLADEERIHGTDAAATLGAKVAVAIELAMADRHAEALVLFKRARALATRHPDVQPVASAFAGDHARSLLVSMQIAEAEPLLLEALAALEAERATRDRWAYDARAEQQLRAQLIIARLNRGGIGHADSALRAYHRATESETPFDPWTQALDVLDRLRQDDGTEALHAQTLERLVEQCDADARSPIDTKAQLRYRLAVGHYHAQRPAEAIALLRSIEDLYVQVDRAPEPRIDGLVGQAVIAMEAGQFTEATRLAAQTKALLVKHGPAERLEWIDEFLASIQTQADDARANGKTP